MGLINIRSLAAWVQSPDWLSRILVLCEVCQALRWSRLTWWREMRTVSRLCIEYPGICLTTEENYGKNRSGYGRALGSSAPNAITLVELAITGNGLDWPVVPCRPWLSRQATEWTLGQPKYPPCCRTRGFLISAKFESKLSVRALMCVGKQQNAQILVYLPVNYVPGAPVAMRRNLGCNTCSLRTRVRAADLHAVHA